MLRTTLTAVLAFAATAIACERLCEVNKAQSDGSGCVYDCHADIAGGRSAHQNAVDFASALQGQGLECSADDDLVMCQGELSYALGCENNWWSTIGFKGC